MAKPKLSVGGQDRPAFVSGQGAFGVAGGLTYREINLGYGNWDKVAAVIHKIEYDMTDALQNVFFDVASAHATTFACRFGLSGTNNLAAGVTNSYLESYGMIDYNVRMMAVDGVPSTESALYLNNIENGIVERDFTGVGGLLVPAKPIYIWSTTSAPSLFSGLFSLRLWYTLVDLSPAEYLELFQQWRLSNIQG